MADGVSESEARTKLANDYAFCKKYNFRGSAFVSTFHYSLHFRIDTYLHIIENADQPGAIYGSDMLDTDSIMMYPSVAESVNPSACTADIGECPLVKRAGKTPGGDLKFDHIWPGPGPSQEDLEFVRKHYPWYDEA